MSRRVLIVLLVGVNLALLAGTILTAYSPPAAMAQAVAADQRGEYLLVTANTEVMNDAIYLLDSGRKQLHVFRTNFPHIQGQPVQVYFFASRDLAKDFGIKPAAK